MPPALGTWTQSLDHQESTHGALVNSNVHPFRSLTQASGHFCFSRTLPIKFQRGQKLQSVRSPIPEATIQINFMGKQYV